MQDCIFCKIVKGEAPSHKVYETEKVLAFLSIGPVNKGHALVIPKEHYENVFDIPENLLKDAIAAVKKVSAAVMKATDAHGIVISQNNHAPAGQVVFHFHFHVIPRYSHDGLKLWPHKKYEGNEFEEYSDRIRSAMSWQDL